MTDSLLALLSYPRINSALTMSGTASSRPLAITHGASFPDRAKMPKQWKQSLAQALQNAATTDKGLRYIDAQGVETVQSYGELLSAAESVAVGLRSQLFKSPEHSANQQKGNQFVILQCPNSVELVIALWGCILGDFIPVPVATQSIELGVSPLSSALELLERPIILTTESYQKALSRQLESTKFEDATITIESLVIVQKPHHK